jgi:uncharacterized protein YndB with AHSA1/START domain
MSMLAKTPEADSASNREWASLEDEGTTLTMQRRLPGPIERVWAYMARSDLRQQWLAAGDMSLQPGTSFELIWRNDQLSASDDPRPQGFGAESRATCQLIEVEAPRWMRFVWPGVGEVSFELSAATSDDPGNDGGDVLLTITHRQLSSREMVLLVGAGWHAHLDILSALTGGSAPPSFWRNWAALKEGYAQKFSV